MAVFQRRFFWAIKYRPMVLNTLQHCSSSTDLRDEIGWTFLKAWIIEYKGYLVQMIIYVFWGISGMLPVPTLWWALPGWPENPGYGPARWQIATANECVHVVRYIKVKLFWAFWGRYALYHPFSNCDTRTYHWWYNCNCQVVQLKAGRKLNLFRSHKKVKWLPRGWT